MPAKVYHYDLYGKRKDKYEFLKNNSVSTVDWTELQPDPKYHFFVPKDFSLQQEWEKGVKVSELFGIFNSGVKTDRDSLFIDQDKNELAKRFQTLLSGEFDFSFRDKYRVVDSGSFKITERIKNKTFSQEFIRKIQYRPFDYQWIYYDPEIVSRPAWKTGFHFQKENFGLVLMRTQVNSKEIPVWISNSQNDLNFYGFQTYNFPLYLYPENGGGDLFFDENVNNNTPSSATTPLLEKGEYQSKQTYFDKKGKSHPKPKPNFNPEIIKQIESELGMTLDWEAGIGESNVEEGLSFQDSDNSEANGVKNGETGSPLRFTPTDLLDYIYAILHSPSYREKYKEFLKIDFPRIPFDLKNGETGSPLQKFWQLVKLGSQLRKLHLMEGINPLELELGELGGEGENVVEKVRFERNTPSSATTPLLGKGESSKVWINDTKYFDNVPELAWNFYIGGYQPAQKWLKDRKGRELSFNDIMHYQKIVHVLGETARLMGKIR